MKKILMLTHEFLPFSGGVATYCAEMAATAATELGHDVTVLAPDYHQDNSAEDAKRPYRVIRFPGHFYSFKRLPRILWETFKINAADYDLVHAADWSFAITCRALSPVKGLPVVTTLHGTDILGIKTSRAAKLLKARDVLKYCRSVTANSQYTADLTMANHPYYPADKVRVTLLGVGPWWFGQAGDTEDLRRRYNIPADREILLSVARLVPRKGHACVLEALALLPQQDKDRLFYVIAGKADSEEYEQHLRSLAERCGVPVLFAGRIGNEDVRSFYKASWLFCLPGQYDEKTVEGFGLVYLEAAAQSLPSLATVIGGVPEVVIDGKTGWLLEDQSPKALAGKISGLLARPDEVREAGRQALEWAKSFSWKRCAEQTYNDL